MKTMTVLLIAAALAGCGRSEEEFKALEGQLAKTRGDAAQERDKAQKELDAAKAATAAADQAREEALKKAAETQKQVEATMKDLARAADELKAAQTAHAAAQKERDEIKSQLAGMAKSVEEAKAAGSAAAELQAKLAAKEQEIAQAKSAAESAAAKIAKLEEEVSAVHRTEALGTRLGYKGKETLQPYLVLPLTFNAKKGETLSWSWSVTEAPAGLTADALDFAVVGPDQTKAYGAHAGWQKKDDKASLTAPAEGRWTVVWSNRHPAAAFTIEFEASLKPMQ